MNLLPEIVQKYLNKYAAKFWTFEHKLNNQIDNAIVIPVLSEYENLKTLLRSLLSNDNKYFNRTTLIIVVNNFENSTDEVKNDNQKSLNFLRQINRVNDFSDSLAFEIRKSNLNVCLIDASSNGLEMSVKYGGVGLARKIGMDSALKIFNYSSNNKKILICLDADCTVDSNYLTTIIDEFNDRNLSSAVVKFKHNLDDDTTKQAIICYEIFLHYYVLGLKYAGSNYAFHTLGSTMICDYESYIKVEGMNKRKAAEDFYFLEKLAKNYLIETIDSTTVYLSSRKSWRVPFGTGQHVKRFLSRKQNEYLLYDPRSFDVLKNWLEIFLSEQLITPFDYLELAKSIHPDLVDYLIEQNFEDALDKICANTISNTQLSKQKNKWFDGFRTLKLIHYLRDKTFQQINMFEALNNLFNRMGIIKDFFWYEKEIPDLHTQKKYLELLRELVQHNYDC